MARRPSKGALPSSAEAELEKAIALQSIYGFSVMCLQAWSAKGGRRFSIESEDSKVWKITLSSLRVRDHVVEEKSEDLQTAIDEAIKRFG